VLRERDIDLDALARGVVAGERRSIARALRVIDDFPLPGRQLASRLHPHLTGAEIIGVTGHPGAGKSTVVDQMLFALREQNKRTAVLAVDPSSPFSGGAILGDRVRMSRHFDDDGVFIRSLATRGALGGLSRSTFDSVRVLDAAGFDVIIIETVGVGQDEVDVIRLADTTVVVLVPGLGDDVQAIKAGLLEVADIFLANKADRPGIDDLERSLQTMLSLLPLPEGAWEVPVLKSIASTGEGIATLVDYIARHNRHTDGAAGQQRSQARQRELFVRLLDASLIETGRARLGQAVDEALRKVVDENADPYTLVLELVEGDTP